MAGIKDLLSLFYWLNNQKEFLLKESVEQEAGTGSHKTDRGQSPKKSNAQRKYVERFEDSSKNDKE